MEYTQNMSGLIVRNADRADAPALLSIINPIIAHGGMTAIQPELTLDQVVGYFIEGTDHLFCHVAIEEASGSVVGFQSLERKSGLPPGWADIATFARLEPRVPGVGSHLFDVTRRMARAAGIETINATIRADSVRGLAYYSRLGFVDYGVTPAVALRDGRLVDRIHKKYELDSDG